MKQSPDDLIISFGLTTALVNLGLILLDIALVLLAPTIARIWTYGFVGLLLGDSLASVMVVLYFRLGWDEKTEQ